MCASLVVLILAAALGFAQAPGDAAQGRRRILLTVTQAADAGWDPDTLTMFSRALIGGLQMDPEMRRSNAVLVDPLSPLPAASDDAMSAAAVSQGADAWLWIGVTRAADAVTLRVRSMDTRRQEIVITSDVAVKGSLAPLDLAGVDWSSIAHLVATAYPSTGEAAPLESVAPGTARLVVHGRPGSTLSLHGRPDVLVGSDGKATLDLEAPAQYEVRATARGYAPVSRSLYLAASREISIDQKLAPSWAVEAWLADLAYPGAGFSWYFLPDSAFLAAGFTTYGVGLAFTRDVVFFRSPLTYASVRVGAYLSPADSVVRPSVALGGFVRVIDAPVYAGLDPLAPLGVQLFLGAEIGGGQGALFFIEYIPQLFFTQFPALLEASLGTGDAPPGWVFGTGMAANLLALRIGYRWKL